MRAFLPTRVDENELATCVTIAYRVFAQDLGSLYDATLRPLDPDWLVTLQRRRPNPVNLADPYFVLDEPLRNQDSVTRVCFGKTTPDFWQHMEAARRARNAWVHVEVAVTVKATMEALRPLIAIAGTLGLACESEIVAVYERLTALAAGNTFDTLADATQVDEYIAQVEESRRAEEEARQREAEAFERARREIDQRRSIERHAGGLEAEIERLTRELEVAMEGWGNAVAMAAGDAERRAHEYELEIERLRQLLPEPPEEIVLPAGLEPGDPWPESLDTGAWELDLKRALVDFLDISDQRLLSDRLPDQADAVRSFAATCLQAVEPGGLVYVDHCGHVVRWAYPTPDAKTYVGTMPREWVDACRGTSG